MRAWIVIAVFFATSAIFLFSNLYSFLSLTEEINANVLVVEGWVPDYVFEEVLKKAEKKNYKKIVVTGVPILKGSYLLKYKTYAELGSATLKKMGLSDEIIEAIPAPFVQKDRTYASAVAIKEWLISNDIKSIDLVTSGCHARRSRLLFEKAFENNIAVGIITIPEKEFNPRKWYRTSNGVRTVISEAIAYVYAQFLF